MNIIVDLDYKIQNGTEVVFRSPVDCSQVTGLIVYYDGGSQEFAFADAHGNNVGDIDHLFAENVVVKVILDVTYGMAFVQNADTNAYLEGRFAEISVALDTTLTQEGMAADAKATGEAIQSVRNDLGKTNEAIESINTELGKTNEAVQTVSDGVDATNDTIKSISVTPQMFGAVGDGVADDTAAVRAAIASGSTVYFPKGTYLITETITINDAVRMYGAGIAASTIKYTGSGYLFEIKTKFTNPAILEHLSFTGKPENSFINCDSGSWGGCVVMRDFYVYSFHTVWMRFASAFKATFENGTIRSRGKCIMTTFDGTITNNNFCNCITFTNVYISNIWSGDATIPVMFELCNVRQIQFTECALERCDVMFKDFVPEEYLNSGEYDPASVTVADLNLDRCWFEYSSAIYDFQYNGIAPKAINCRYTQIKKYNVNAGSGQPDNLPGCNTMWLRNGETSTVESLVLGTPVDVHRETVYNLSDTYTNTFYPYVFASDHTELNLPLNSKAKESADGLTVSYDIRSIHRYSSIAGSFRVKVFCRYNANNISIWEAEVFSYKKNYFLTKCEKVFTKGSGVAATATESLVDTLTTGGILQFTTDTKAEKLAMVIEYNAHKITM